MKIKTTQVGTHGLKISRIGLGCVTFGREIDEKQSFKILDYAFERGITLLDTAEAYGGGQARQYREQRLGLQDVREVTGEMHSSEKIVGRWLASTGLRKQIILQTKVTANFTPSHVAEALDRSLERLQTDHVDIYLLHKYETTTPLETALTAMDAAVRDHKTILVGCSNFDAKQLRSAIALARERNLAKFEITQPIYNLAHREIEDDLLSFCESERIAAIVYSPLGAGFLTGKYKADAPFPKGSRFDVIPDHANEYFNERNFRLIKKLRTLAERSGLSMARLAMSWVLSNPAVQSVLIGARTLAHIDNAVDSLNCLEDSLLHQISQWT